MTDENSFAMDWANARLISFLSREYADLFSVAVFSDPVNNEKYNQKLQVEKVYKFPFPFTQIGGLTNIFRIYREFKKIESENDILIVQLPILGFSVLLFNKKKILYHVCANVLSAAENPLKYKGVMTYLATFFARLVYYTNRNLFAKKESRLIVNGTELGKLYQKFNPMVVISSSLDKTDIIGEDEWKEIDSFPLRIIFVGRPSLEKGFDLLVKTLMHLTIDFELTVIGFTREEFHELLPDIFQETRPIHSRIKFEGYINWGEQFKSIMRNQHFLVVPSRSEGTPRVILEAMSQGVPVIASNVGGVPDIVIDQQNGLLFQFNSGLELQKKIMFFASNEPLRRKMALGGVEFAKRHTILEFGTCFIEKIQHLTNE